MTNEQKYKTTEERKFAHTAYCNRIGDECPLLDDRGTDTKCTDCAFHWLALKAKDEKPEPCPFCRRNVTESMTVAGGVFIDCKCGYRSEVAVGGTPHELKLKAIAAHNRVARAVRAAEKGYVK